MEMELSPSANSGYEGRVCIFCRCDCFDHNFLILDFDAAPNSTGFIEKSPTLRIDRENLGYARFCVSDPYVYVIGADSDDGDFISKSEKVWMSRYDLRTHFLSKSNEYTDVDICPSELEQGLLSKSNKYTDVDIGPSELEQGLLSKSNKYTDVDITPSELEQSKSNKYTDVDIGPSELEQGRLSDMKYPKLNPRVIASRDGKRVVVYSQCIEYIIDEDQRFDTNDPNFELFDSESRIWTTLPQLILCIPGGFGDHFYIKDSKSDLWIESWGGHLCDHAPIPHPYSWYSQIIAANFINVNTLLVTIEAGLMFTLNLDSPQEGWKQYGDEHIGCLRDEFVVVEPEPVVVLTPSQVRVVRRRKEEDEVVLRHRFDLSSDYPTRNRERWARVFVLKYVENQECVTCNVTYGVDEDTSYPFMICDVFKLDLVPGNGNDCRPNHLGSYKYTLTKMCYTFSVEDVVPFPTAIESQQRQKRARAS